MFWAHSMKAFNHLNLSKAFKHFQGDLNLAVTNDSSSDVYRL